MTEFRFVHGGLIGLVAMLLAASCSGLSGNGEIGLDTSGTFDEVAVVDELHALSGSDPVTAGSAFLLAVDRGYDLRVLLAAILGGQFSVDGIVLDNSGNHFAASGADAGFISDKVPLDPVGGSALGLGLATLVGFRQQNTVTRAELRDSLFTDLAEADLGFGAGAAPPPEQRAEPWDELDDQDAFNRMHTLRIVLLIAAGFSPEQIIEAMIFGDAANCDIDFDDCAIGDEKSPNDHLYEGLFGRDLRAAEESAADDLSSASTGESAPEPSGEETVPSAGLRVWQGEFVETRGTATWSTVRTTRINIEEHADGTLTMTRETDEDHTEDAAVFSPACPYVATEDANYGPSPVGTDGSLRFTGDMNIGFIVNDCGEQSSAAAPGTFPDIVTGTLAGDTLTLDTWYDGQGPVTLDPPSTSR